MVLLHYDLDARSNARLQCCYCRNFAQQLNFLLNQ